MMEQAVMLAGIGAALAIAWPGKHRRSLAAAAVFCLAATNIWLASRFLADDFSYRQVWLQSDPNLAWRLKLAGLWSGDEGTLLLLALIAAVMTVRLLRYGPAAAAGAGIVTSAFAAGAMLWSPFEATAAGDLAAAPYRGMNAHLTSVWMLVHPPLVFVSYLLLVAPVGAMVAAIAVDDDGWRRLSGRYARAAWLLISAGIAFGMWWAYEDFTYGTLWHWDPVQTAIFAAWCYLTAMLHLQTRYRPGGAYAVAHPVLGLMAAASAMAAMAVTRSDALASSHRYVGETSLVFLATLAIAIIAAGGAAGAYRLAAGRTAARSRVRGPLMLWVAVLVLTLAGGIAHGHLANAFISAYLELPRPGDLKPFFETLRNFAPADELAALRAAFAQWDVDNFRLNRWFVPLLIAAGIAGGHFIMPASRSRRWMASLACVLTASALVIWVRPFEHLFDGRGLTSGKTIALFAQLDALLAALGYLLLATIAVAVMQLRARQRVMSIPSALIHAGVVLALFGGLAATVLDRYAQHIISLPQATGHTVQFAGGYTVQIGAVETDEARDGARAQGTAGAFRTAGQVSWLLSRDGRRVDGGAGHAIYRDSRSMADHGTGAIRLMCEAIDYRFARYRSADSQMIHPLISRGLLRDVQIWLPAALPAAGAHARREVPVILKVYPLMSLVWIGLALSLIGSAWQTVQQFTQVRRRS
jgi:cytochrome c-type biogenesis protein CcmF